MNEVAKRVFVVIFFMGLFLAAVKSQPIRIVTYKSTVLSSGDSSAIPFVHVHFENLPIGTITNSIGEFTINFNDSLISENIVFSCIGFKARKILLKDAIKSNTDYDSVFLDQDITVLNEVTVLESKVDTLGYLIKKVIDKIPVNYPTERFFSKGFYRQISQNGDSASRLVEAAIDIHDPGYSKPIDKVKIKIIQFRKSNDYISYSWTRSLVKMLLGTTNDLLETYRMDFLREGNVLMNNSDGKIFTYELKLDSIVGNGNERIACITFNSGLEKISQPYFYGHVFVNLSDFAIRRIDYSWLAHPNYSFPRQNLVFYNGTVRFRKVIEYQKIGTKYYPLFMSVFEPISGVAGSAAKLQFKESFVLVNEVILERSQFSRLKKKEIEKEDEDIYEQSFPYDPEFWNTYNIVVINPVKEEDRFSLEKTQRLNEQFIKNGNRRGRK